LNSTQLPATRPVRLLLINPRSPDSFWSFRWAMDKVLKHQSAPNPPLGLATLAALCPPHWSVEIVDETVQPLPEMPEADIVGVGGMGVQHPRQRELLEYYRQRGYYTVAGGSFASLCPERLEGHCDSVIAGEAEYIWANFCKDFDAGKPEPVYQEQGSVALEDVPVPRFDLLQLNKYGTASLQFSRGCPYRCDFCDIIVMFGRKPRTKPPEQIGRELDELRQRGMKSAFFVDDNLIGNKKTAKQLLRYLIDYQERHGFPFCFGTEASLNLADDPELLDLFRRAGFGWVFLGIESPDVASLQEAGKVQNTRSDLLESVRTIYRSGIDVYAGFIVGFDNDTVDVFERQYQFILNAGIQVSMVGLLTALPRTPLYERLDREGRLRHDIMPGDNTRAKTNVLPAGMEYDQLIEGYKTLYRRLFADRGIALRIRNKTRYLRRPVPQPTVPWRQQLGLLHRALRHAVLPGGPVRWLRFLDTLRCSPRLWPLVIGDWVRGMSMRAYADRFFNEPPPEAWSRLTRALTDLKGRFAAYFERGDVAAAVEHQEAGPNLVITLTRTVDDQFWRTARRTLVRLLRQPHVNLTLQIEQISERQRKAVLRILDHLEQFGERVGVYLSDSVRDLVGPVSPRLHYILK